MKKKPNYIALIICLLIGVAAVGYTAYEKERAKTEPFTPERCRDYMQMDLAAYAEYYTGGTINYDSEAKQIIITLENTDISGIAQLAHTDALGYKWDDIKTTLAELGQNYSTYCTQHGCSDVIVVIHLTSGGLYKDEYLTIQNGIVTYDRVK